MKLDVILRGWKSDAHLSRSVSEQVRRFRHLAAVSAARVVLERRSECAPAWSASAHLEVPGPDLRVEARDHTAAAAWRKVVQGLEREIVRRTRARRRPDGRRGPRALPHGA